MTQSTGDITSKEGTNKINSFIAENTLISDFEACVSVPRFSPYKSTHVEAARSIALYLWNMKLCESLYPALQSLEVAVRNAVHAELTTLKHTDMWYMDMYLIEPADQLLVNKAQDDLYKKHKPISPQNVISELSFGFWTSLFSTRYEMKLVRPIIKHVFKYAQKQDRSPEEVSRRLQKARELRNRVFHHEPIWHYIDLQERHRVIIETVGWISPLKRELLDLIDTFPSVYSQGLHVLEEKIRFLIELNAEQLGKDEK